MHFLVICGFVTAFVMEFFGMVLTWRSARHLVGVVRGIELTLIPPVLLCVCFVVLAVENYMLSRQSLIHVAADGVGGVHGRPVYTAVLMEWCVNVPMVLVLSGACALNRPISEVSRPVLVTNLYITVSWASYFVINATWRWAAVSVAFFMYAWASYDMATWVFNFRAATRADIPARTIRCVLTFGLIFVFFIYGMVFLAAFVDLVSARQELVWYVGLDFGVKVSFLILFAYIRLSQFYDLLVTVLANKALDWKRQHTVVRDPDKAADVLPLIE